MARTVLWLALSHAKPSYGVLYHIKLCVKVVGFSFYYSFEGEGKNTTSVSKKSIIHLS